MFANYLNKPPKLRPALIDAGIPEDVATIVEVDLSKFGYFGHRSYLNLAFLPVIWFGFFSSVRAFELLGSIMAFGPAIATMGLFGGIAGVSANFLLMRYVKWYRARSMCMIALNRSHAFFGRINSKALRAAEGKSGQAFICAATRSAHFDMFAFCFGAMMSATSALIFSEVLGGHV